MTMTIIMEAIPGATHWNCRSALSLTKPMIIMISKNYDDFTENFPYKFDE